jgi:hypothetical protein
MITVKGGNNMKDIEKKIEEWKRYERELSNKIKQEKDEHKRSYLIQRHNYVVRTLEKLREKEWKEL